MPNKKRPEFLLSFGRFHLYILVRTLKNKNHGKDHLP